MKFLNNKTGEHKSFLDGVSFDGIKDGWKETYSVTIEADNEKEENLYTDLEVSNDDRKLAESLFVTITGDINGREVMLPVMPFTYWAKKQHKLGDFKKGEIANLNLNFKFLGSSDKKSGANAEFDFNFGSLDERK